MQEEPQQQNRVAAQATTADAVFVENDPAGSLIANPPVLLHGYVLITVLRVCILCICLQAWANSNAQGINAAATVCATAVANAFSDVCNVGNSVAAVTAAADTCATATTKVTNQLWKDHL